METRHKTHSNTSTSNVVIHTSAGQKIVQLQSISPNELEKLRQYYHAIGPGQTPPTLSVTMGMVLTEVNTIFMMADQSQVPELSTIVWQDNKWLEWTFDQLFPILKKCLNLMTTAADVTSIKTALDKVILHSSNTNWHLPMNFVEYKVNAYAVLKDSSVVNLQDLLN